MIFSDPDKFYAVRNFPLKDGQMYLFLGEVHDMAGHCIVAEYPHGQIYAGIHSDNFVPFNDEEWHYDINDKKWVKNS